MKNIPKSFIGFLIASAFIWLLINLSKEYTQILPFEITYDKLSQNKIFHDEPIKKIDIKVTATGFKLFSAGFSDRVLKISLNKLKRGKKKYYLLMNTKEAEIQNQLPEGLQLKKIIQDTVYFDLGNLASKKVPVTPNLSINYELGFDATQIKVSPDSVLLSGTKKQLKQIDVISLASLSKENVSGDISENVAIIVPEELKNINVSAKEVNLFVKVDKITEGEFNIPVTLKNIISDKITMYPKTVKVVFKVGLNDFNKVTQESFEVEADYGYTKENSLSYLLPKLKTKPEFVSDVRIIPEKIDFLIHK